MSLSLFSHVSLSLFMSVSLSLFYLYLSHFYLFPCSSLFTLAFSSLSQLLQIHAQFLPFVSTPALERGILQIAHTVCVGSG